MTIRKDIFQIGRSGEPSEIALILLERINGKVSELSLPVNWIVRKDWKPFPCKLLANGQVAYIAMSWVMEFYINHSLYEQFYIHNPQDLYKIAEGKEKLQKKIDTNPSLLDIPPELGKTKY